MEPGERPPPATTADTDPVRSHEHVALAFVPLAALAEVRLSEIYRVAIAAAAP